jgi:regulator of protease activity HflC (stomatin/prohibitin superfamily)
MSEEMSSHEAERFYVRPTSEHVSLGKPLRGLLFLVPYVPLAFLLYRRAAADASAVPSSVVTAVLVGIVWGVLVAGVRVAAQWERGVILRLGNFHSLRGPGLIYIIPVLEYVRFVDTRTLVVNIPAQKVITKDNVPAEIDGALFFMVTDAGDAITSVQDYRFAMTQYSQAALRDVVGALSLDELLSEREHIQQRIGENVEAHVKEWGIHVDSIRLQDIELPEDLKRMMSRQASAEREKRATITKSEGDKLAAQNLAAAAQTMQTSHGAMQLRTLQTIDGLGPSPSNTIVFFPTELMGVLKALSKAAEPTATGDSAPADRVINPVQPRDA